ncbi:hypothetical protein [Methylobacterium planeticum]|uniref:Uncharacterized protein n=1 Tax=Methylobacterium planeticum TaxID=2615211 RepID=A0A6N6MIE3_9HYPH|nr:hypothetical protein [Methylobacterium planeticum]KAB1069263.1 hypothetical protein F6X51_25655 [Methylobacterium planeticum]
MADLSELIPTYLSANTQTDVTGNGANGMPAASAGTYTLNLCNDSDAEVVISAIYLTKGEAPTQAHKIHPSHSVEGRGYSLIQPIKIGAGWKLFVTASGPISAQLIGRKEG